MKKNILLIIIINSLITISSLKTAEQATQEEQENTKIAIVKKRVEMRATGDLLDIQDRNINRIYFERTSVLRFITILNISGNNLTVLENNVFDYFTQLEHLFLQRNKLKYIEPEFFKKLVNLTKIDLSHNALTDIDPVTFKTNKKLEILDISDNKLTIINPETFAKLATLFTLGLSKNNLTQPTEEALVSTLQKTCIHCILELNDKKYDFATMNN